MRSCRRAGQGFVLALLCGCAWPAVPQARVDDCGVDLSLLGVAVDEPRAFGYQVGDRVARVVSLHVPAGLTLDATSLPRAGARGQPLELQSVTRRERTDAGGLRIELRLQYQVFAAPPQVRTFELPGFELRFDGQPRAQTARVEAWPVTVAPLVPEAVSPRRGLGELQADRTAPPIDTAPARGRLLACAVAVMLLLLVLAQVYIGLPWLARRRRPYAQAWRALRRPPRGSAADEGSGGGGRAAWQRMHDAVNRSAGVVLFEPGIPAYLARRPQFAALHDDLGEFFRRSRAVFFAEGASATTAADTRWLQQFCRRCRDAERGSA